MSTVKRYFGFGTALIILLSLCFSDICAAESTVPYLNYNYSEETGAAEVAPQAYLPERVIYASDIGVSDFKDVSDVFYGDDGLLYILDSGNSRVISLNADFTLNKIFSCAFTDEKGEQKFLSGAKGLFVDDNYIYVADSQNARILVMNRISGELVRVITTPVADVLDEDFIFKPIKLAVDNDGLLYVVSEGTYEGILNLSAEGEFLCFFGSNTVSTSAWDLFWRRFSTKEQRKTMVQLIPQDFSSIAIDSDGFFLATLYTAQESSMVKRLNPGGNDIIRKKSRTGIIGDPGRIWDGSLAGTSSFVDIASGPDNIYACLDYTRGRVFCYDYDGFMIYTFGTLADQTGGFSSPTALTYLNDGKIAVLDTRNGSVTVFTPTVYGKAINESIHYGRILDYDNALKSWQNVLDMNNNFDMAHNEIGQLYYNQEKYEEAADEFRAASNKQMYSKAHKEYQSAWIYNNIYWCCTAVAAVALPITAFIICRRIRRKRANGK